MALMWQFHLGNMITFSVHFQTLPDTNYRGTRVCNKWQIDYETSMHVQLNLWEQHYILLKGFTDCRLMSEGSCLIIIFKLLWTCVLVPEALYLSDALKSLKWARVHLVKFQNTWNRFNLLMLMGLNKLLLSHVQISPHSPQTTNSHCICVSVDTKHVIFSVLNRHTGNLMWQFENYLFPIQLIVTRYKCTETTNINLRVG